MDNNDKIQIFEDKKIRTAWNEETEQLLYIIRSIPSPKAEPFKMWLSQI